MKNSEARMICTPFAGQTSVRGTYHSHQLRVKSFWLNMLLEGVKLFNKEEIKRKELTLILEVLFL